MLGGAILQGYVDSHTVGDKDGRRSITWYVFIVGGTKNKLGLKVTKGHCTLYNKGWIWCNDGG